MKTSLLFALYFSFFMTLSHCSHHSVKQSNSAENFYQSAEQLYNSGRYDEAIEKFRQIRNKFSKSPWALKAELKVADIYFEKGDFIEAQQSYILFRELHPQNKQNDYVTFQIAMSSFKQLPSTVDRDLSPSKSALVYFDEVLRLYPKSKYAKEAQKHKKKILQMLAGKEFYIAQFYFKRKKWAASLNRYEKILKNFPLLGFDAKSLKGASLASMKTGDKQKSLRFWKKLNALFPTSLENQSTTRELKKNGLF